MSFPQDVIYTGSQGAGMTATIAESLGSMGAQMSWQDKIAERTDTQRYRVAGAPTSYDAELALKAAGLGYGSHHPYIPGVDAWAVKMEAASQEGFVMQVMFKRPPAGQFPPGEALLTSMSISFTAMEIPAELDAYGNVVVNSAGDPFDPPQNLTIYLTRIRYVKWQTSYDLAVARAMIGKVNHASVTLGMGTVPARCLKILNWAPATEIFPGYSILIPTVYDLEYRGSEPVDGDPGGYDRKIIDRGFNAWYSGKNVSPGGVSAGGTFKGKLEMKSNLQPPAQPVLLDGTGQPLLQDPYSIIDYKNGFYGFHAADPVQTPVVAGDAENYLKPAQAGANLPFYLPYRIEREADFAPLVAAGI